MTPEVEQKHIVVITDDSSSERALIKEGTIGSTEATLSIYETETADELYNVLDRLLYEKQVPGLIILDFLLGAVNGLTVANYIRKHYPPIPVVMFGSCLGSGDYIADLYRMGINAYIVKPETAGEYNKVMSKLVDVWLHQPQPSWSFRSTNRINSRGGSNKRSMFDRRRYDRRSSR